MKRKINFKQRLIKSLLLLFLGFLILYGSSFVAIMVF